MSNLCVHLSRRSLCHSLIHSCTPARYRPFSFTTCLHAKARKPPEDDDGDASGPIKFSTSRASHRQWKVERSLGSTHQRPWWKVLPISLLCASFLLWCVFRKESDIDQSLQKNLFEHLPGLESDDEGDEERPS